MSLASRNTKTQGVIGLGAAIAWFTSHGYVVSIPLSDSQRYDLVVELDGRLSRVQVKTSRYARDGVFHVQLATRGGNRSWDGVEKKFGPSDAELLFVVTELGERYLIPTSLLKCKTKLALSNNYRKFIV